MRFVFNFHKILSLVSLLGCMFALSCTDHEIPGDPVALCNIKDGTPRFYDCEFEIVKIDFLKAGSNAVAGTVTKENSSINVSFADASKSYFSGHVASGFVTGIANFPISITLKRIANPAFPAPDGYGFQATGIGEDENPYIDYLAMGNWIKPDINLGETRSINTFLPMSFSIPPPNSSAPCDICTGGSMMLTIKNPETYSVLNKAPHNYKSLLDRSEAQIWVNINVDE